MSCSCRGRYGWIEKRIKNLPPEDFLASSWAAIRERLDEAIEVRNQLAHGEFTPIMISHNQEIVGFWARLAKNASTGELSFDQQTRTIEGNPFFSTDLLIDRGLEFISLSESLFAMADRAKNCWPRNQVPDTHDALRLSERPEGAPSGPAASRHGKI